MDDNQVKVCLAGITALVTIATAFIAWLDHRNRK